MKRMSEVFELPVDQKKLELYGYEAGEMQDVPYHVAEEHAAHAINHVDALADALDKLLDEVAGDSIHNYLSEEACKAHDAGIAALNAYRGEK
jgi:hypothetical protein